MSLVFASGQLLTASALNALIPVKVEKANTQSVTSSTVLVNDSELAITLSAGYTYRCELHAVAGGALAGDIKLAWARTGTLNHVGARQCTGPGIRTTDVSDTSATGGTLPNIPGVVRYSGGHSLTTAVNYGTDGTSTTAILETFEIQVDVTGVLTLQWAQDTSSGTASQILAGSYLLAFPVA